MSKQARKTSPKAIDRQNIRDCLDAFEKLGSTGSATAEAWLMNRFVAGIRDNIQSSGQNWVDQAYKQALLSRSPGVQAGIAHVMNQVMTAGVEVGRTVFATWWDCSTQHDDVVAEFDVHAEMEAIIADGLGLDPAFVRMYYSASFAPAHAGLLCLSTTLLPLANPKRPGERPHARTRRLEPIDGPPRPSQRLIPVLVSVARPTVSLQAVRTKIGSQAQAKYWGPEDTSPAGTASLTLREALPCFEVVRDISWKKKLQDALSITNDEGVQPVARKLKISSPRYGQFGVPSRQVFLQREPGQEKLLYEGMDADFFLARLEGLML